MAGTEGIAKARSGPAATTEDRVSARLVDLVVELVVGVALVALLPLGERPVAAVALLWCLATAYEAAAVVMFGATLGKRTRNLRVLALDTAAEAVPADQALARAAAAASATFGPLTCVAVAMTNVAPVLFVIGAGWAVAVTASTLLDPLGRGPADRVASTIVVPTDVAPPIRSRDLAGYADGVRPPRMCHLGRVGDLDVRTRARFRRLNDAPLLVVVVVLLVLASTVPVARGLLIAASMLVWLVAFVVDETRRVTGSGTFGHRLAGLVVLDRSTGARPTTGRSALRAVTLGLLLYVPVFWPLLGLSMIMMRSNEEGRGLHDRVARTVVVADPGLSPETQRRMAMRVRLGRVS
ncbi:MAG: RDD family protein [Acidimicrobiales bacterium]|nr:RDD family protein [Acidimicrobiales bacterium]